MTRKFAWRCSATACLSLLSACSTFGSGSTPRAHSLQSLQIVSEIGANQDTATALDLVWVFDASAMATLPKTSPQWFAEKSALLASLANGVALVSLQLPPGQVLDAVSLPANHAHAMSVRAYASYLDPAGQAVLVLDGWSCTRIILEPAKVVTQACVAP